MLLAISLYLVITLITTELLKKIELPDYDEAPFWMQFIVSLAWPWFLLTVIFAKK